MNYLKKRIFLELFVTPLTIIPILFGGSMILLSEILGGHAAFVGFISLLLGMGSFSTNLVFNLENIRNRVFEQWKSQQIKQREQSLDVLDRKLQNTIGKRDENALRDLRDLYKSFVNSSEDGNLNNFVPQQMFELIDEIFSTCVLKLEKSYEIYKTEKSMSGKTQSELKKQRELIISEVEASIVELTTAIGEVQMLKFKTENNELGDLKKKLSFQLQVAKAIEEGMSEISNPDSVIAKRLKEYE